jgi:Uma2 family endonuclease
VNDVDVLAAPPVRVEAWEALAVPDGYRAEIIRGELVVTPSPTLSHGRAQSRLTLVLSSAAPPGYEPVSGPEWRLTVAGIVAMAPQPDIMVVTREVTGAALLRPPLLAVEILSPSDYQRLANDMTRREGKLADYAANGLEDYLEVDLTTTAPTASRYELRQGRLVQVDVAVGSAALRASRPFRYEFVPQELL